MSNFVDSVFAFSPVQPAAGGDDSAYQWKPSAEQVNVLMAEDNHTQAGFPFQVQLNYQSPTHTSAIANPQDSYSHSHELAESSAVYSYVLPAYQKRMRDVSVSGSSQPIFADDQSADAQRKAKRSRLIREYSNGILTHANMSLPGHSGKGSHANGNGDFSGVLDDLSIPILFPDAKPSPLSIPADEDDAFDFQRMNNPERSPLYYGAFLFKSASPAPSMAIPATGHPAFSSNSSVAASSSVIGLGSLMSSSVVPRGIVDVSATLSDSVEGGEQLAAADSQQQLLQQAVPGSLARFLPNSPTHVLASVPAEMKAASNQPEVQQPMQVEVVASSCVAAATPAENASEATCSAAANTPRTQRAYDTRRHSLQQCAAQMHTPTQSDSSVQTQVAPSSPSAGISTRARRPASPQHTPGAIAVLHTSTGVAIPPLRLSAARASHRLADGDDSNRAVKQAKRITVDLTKGGVELEVFERYYQRANDGSEYKIRLIRLVNRRSGRSDVYCHAADLGGVVERKSNISRLFGQFESPKEKILMNVIGAHSLSIGQESNILTYYGVRRFFDVSKMKGQLHFRRWIETVLLPDLQATTQVSAVQLLPPKNESDAMPVQPLGGAGKKEKTSGRKDMAEDSDHEIDSNDAPPSLSSDDESSSDSTDDMEEDDADD